MDEQRTSATTKDSFGEHLRREREMRGVTLDEIAAATRIGTRFLEAFENEQWDRLPGGVFNRGFVRSIAHFLGLDEENLLAEYSLATSGLPRPSSWTLQTHPAEPERHWVPWVVLATVVALAAAGGWIGWRHYRSWKRGRATASAPAMQVSRETVIAPPATPPPAQAASSDSSATAVADSAPRTADSSPARTAPAPAPAAASDLTAPLTLKIEAGKSTTVRVMADGVDVFDGKVSAGSSQTFQATGEFQISVRDAGALLLELNGQTLPPIGPPGKAGEITLSHDTLAHATGGGH
ncbi:MAG: helix-turn-helix domain-containing protein [Candidatus Acidiferrales bacterium]